MGTTSDRLMHCNGARLTAGILARTPTKCKYVSYRNNDKKLPGKVL